MPGHLMLSSCSFLNRICVTHIAGSLADPQRAAWGLVRYRQISLSVWRLSVAAGRACRAHYKKPESHTIHLSSYYYRLFFVAFMWAGPQGQADRPLRPPEQCNFPFVFTACKWSSGGGVPPAQPCMMVVSAVDAGGPLSSWDLRFRNYAQKDTG